MSQSGTLAPFLNVFCYNLFINYVALIVCDTNCSLWY